MSAHYFMESGEFLYLKKLINNGKAKFSFNKFFVRRTFGLWLIYKNNYAAWLSSFLIFFTRGWFYIPFSIFLAWRFHTWWLIIIGISFFWIISWIIDRVIEALTMRFLPRNLLRDENLLNYLWSQNPFHISIVSTEMINQKENMDRMIQELYKNPEYRDSPSNKRYTMTQKVDEENPENPDAAEYLNEKIVSIIIVPPHPWQEVVDKFRE